MKLKITPRVLDLDDITASFSNGTWSINNMPVNSQIALSKFACYKLPQDNPIGEAVFFIGSSQVRGMDYAENEFASLSDEDSDLDENASEYCLLDNWNGKEYNVKHPIFAGTTDMSKLSERLSEFRHHFDRLYLIEQFGALYFALLPSDTEMGNKEPVLLPYCFSASMLGKEIAEVHVYVDSITEPSVLYVSFLPLRNNVFFYRENNRCAWDSAFTFMFGLNSGELIVQSEDTGAGEAFLGGLDSLLTHKFDASLGVPLSEQLAQFAKEANKSLEDGHYDTYMRETRTKIDARFLALNNRTVTFNADKCQGYDFFASTPPKSADKGTARFYVPAINYIWFSQTSPLGVLYDKTFFDVLRQAGSGYVTRNMAIIYATIVLASSQASNVLLLNGCHLLADMLRTMSVAERNAFINKLLDECGNYITPQHLLYAILTASGMPPEVEKALFSDPSDTGALQRVYVMLSRCFDNKLDYTSAKSLLSRNQFNTLTTKLPVVVPYGYSNAVNKIAMLSQACRSHGGTILNLFEKINWQGILFYGPYVGDALTMNMITMRGNRMGMYQERHVRVSRAHRAASGVLIPYNMRRDTNIEPPRNFDARINAAICVAYNVSDTSGAPVNNASVSKIGELFRHPALFPHTTKESWAFGGAGLMSFVSLLAMNGMLTLVGNIKRGLSLGYAWMGQEEKIDCASPFVYLLSLWQRCVLTELGDVRKTDNGVFGNYMRLYDKRIASEGLQGDESWCLDPISYTNSVISEFELAYGACGSDAYLNAVEDRAKDANLSLELYKTRVVMTDYHGVASVDGRVHSDILPAVLDVSYAPFEEGYTLFRSKGFWACVTVGKEELAKAMDRLDDRFRTCYVRAIESDWGNKKSLLLYDVINIFCRGCNTRMGVYPPQMISVDVQSRTLTFTVGDSIGVITSVSCSCNISSDLQSISGKKTTLTFIGTDYRVVMHNLYLRNIDNEGNITQASGYALYACTDEYKGTPYTLKTILSYNGTSLYERVQCGRHTCLEDIRNVSMPDAQGLTVIANYNATKDTLEAASPNGGVDNVAASELKTLLPISAAVLSSILRASFYISDVLSKIADIDENSNKFIARYGTTLNKFVNFFESTFARDDFTSFATNVQLACVRLQSKMGRYTFDDLFNALSECNNAESAAKDAYRDLNDRGILPDDYAEMLDRTKPIDMETGVFEKIEQERAKNVLETNKVQSYVDSLRQGRGLLDLPPRTVDCKDAIDDFIKKFDEEEARKLSEALYSDSDKTEPIGLDNMEKLENEMFTDEDGVDNSNIVEPISETSSDGFDVMPDSLDVDTFSDDDAFYGGSFASTLDRDVYESTEPEQATSPDTLYDTLDEDDEFLGGFSLSDLDAVVENMKSEGTEPEPESSDNDVPATQTSDDTLEAADSDNSLLDILSDITEPTSVNNGMGANATGYEFIYKYDDPESTQVVIEDLRKSNKLRVPGAFALAPTEPKTGINGDIIESSSGYASLEDIITWCNMHQGYCYFDEDKYLSIWANGNKYRVLYYFARRLRSLRNNVAKGNCVHEYFENIMSSCSYTWEMLFGG